MLPPIGRDKLFPRGEDVLVVLPVASKPGGVVGWAVLDGIVKSTPGETMALGAYTVEVGIRGQALVDPEYVFALESRWRAEAIRDKYNVPMVFKEIEGS